MERFPYDTRLDVLHRPLEVIDVSSLKPQHPWFNQTLCQVNSACVRVGIVQGDYHWHKHDDDDEFFFVLEGELFVETEERVFALAPGQGVVIPKGTVHRTRADQRTVMLMVENAGIVPTGD